MCGRGIVKKLHERYPNVNIQTVEYGYDSARTLRERRILQGISGQRNTHYNQILHSVLKGFISVFTEMHFDGVSGIPQLSLESVGLLLVFGFCHILCSFT